LGEGARQEADRREQILEAGLRLFAERGYHGATIKEIAREAGIKSSALIYWYFEDKEDLFRAILKEFSPLVRLTAGPEALMERAPEEVLPMLARAHLDSYDDPVVVRLLRISLSESALNSEVEDQFIGNAQEVVLKFFVAYLERQIELGRIKPHDPQSGAHSFVGMLIIYILNREVFTYLKENLPEKEQYVKDIVGIFLDGLREGSAP
jgi:AcrR family transcriptional regulator